MSVRIGRGLALAAVLLVLSCASWAADQANVLRLQGRAEVIEAGGRRGLAVGDPVRAGDRLRTGESSRLLIRFSDGMELTLSDGAEMVVEDYVWTPERAEGKAALHLAQGSFLLETGAVGKLPDHPLVVRTPVASVGVRGTRFWGGPLDALLSVLLLEGRIVVTSPAGSVALDQPGAGTTITAIGDSPTPPAFWGEERVNRAFATVSFTR